MDKRIHQTITKKLNEIAGSATWQVNGPVIKSRECHIYRGISSSANLDLAIKHYNPQTKLASAHQQFNALKLYQASMAEYGTKDKIPRVYCYDKENRLLVMEWVTGKTLHHHLWNPVTSDRQHSNSINKTGRWLRTFHEAGSIDTRPVDLNIYTKDIDKLIAQYPANAKGHSHHPLFTLAYNNLKSSASNLSSAKAPHAVSHGDFTPFNILLNGDQRIGIDLWAARLKPVQVDLARMIVYLTIAYPLVNRIPIYKPCNNIQGKIIPLVGGYGTDIINPTNLHFKIFLLSEYLRRWLVISNRTSSVISSVTKKYQIFNIKRQLQAILQTLGHN